MTTKNAIKRGIGVDVLQAARDRIAWTFDEFDKIYLSFSAGKDSTVMLHLVADEARKRNRRFGVLVVDLEGQYELTIKHGELCAEMYADCIDLFWICLPLHLRNAVSVYDPFWLCWDPDAEDAWIRRPPEYAITDEKYFPFFSRGMEFEEFVPEFGNWYAEGEKCACFVGIRCDESLNRFRTIARSKKRMYDNRHYTTLVLEQVYNIYPIYDWRASDLWVYHARNHDKPYNALYDYMHRAGVPMGLMRICQPYGDDQRRGLWLFHLIEPQTWSKVVARVNGANGGTLYIQEWGNINGYRGITKPPGHTWETFAKLLVDSMPPKTGAHYRNKILMYQKFYLKRGYKEGIPDEAPYELEQARKAPSWRRICKSLLRNDYWCKGLGFSQHKSSGYQKYLDMMNRRKERWNVDQLALNLAKEDHNLH